jgi:CRP-like cAMP-binding protein
MSLKNKHVASLKKGDFIGDLHYFDKDLPSLYTYSFKSDVALFTVGRDDMVTFAEKNPGLVMKLTLDF